MELLSSLRMISWEGEEEDVMMCVSEGDVMVFDVVVVIMRR